jgi:hypothetical protein
MIRHTGFLTTIAGLGLAVLLAPSSGCSPTATPDSTTHPANPQAPVGAAAPAVPDAPDQPASEAHAGHGAHAGHAAPANATEPAAHDHGAHAHTGHDAQAPGPGPEAPIEPSGEALLAAEQDAYQRAKPVFDKYCASCHSSGGKKARKATLAHFSMDTYPFGGHHETEMGEEMREVLGVTGKKSTMPKDQPGVVQGDELALLVAWSEAFDASHAAGLHQHGDAHGAGHQHGAEKKPGKAPARDGKKKPAPQKKPDATHQHGKEHEGHQNGQHDHGKGHDHGHH